MRHISQTVCNSQFIASQISSVYYNCSLVFHCTWYIWRHGIRLYLDVINSLMASIFFQNIKKDLLAAAEDYMVRVPHADRRVVDKALEAR